MIQDDDLWSLNDQHIDYVATDFEYACNTGKREISSPRITIIQPQREGDQHGECQNKDLRYERRYFTFSKVIDRASSEVPALKGCKVYANFQCSESNKFTQRTQFHNCHNLR